MGFIRGFKQAFGLKWRCSQCGNLFPKASIPKWIQTQGNHSWQKVCRKCFLTAGGKMRENRTTDAYKRKILRQEQDKLDRAATAQKEKERKKEIADLRAEIERMKAANGGQGQTP